MLKTLLLLLGAFYLIAAALPKFGDYWTIANMSTAFAVDPLHFMADVKGVAYPPTFFALQGAWLWLGSTSFSLQPDKFHALLIPPDELWHLPVLGMIPILAALFLFVGIAYKELRHKWLALICFGPITFVSVSMWLD